MFLCQDLMDKQISTFHETVEHAGARWRRLLPDIEPVEGDKLPMGLVLPVIMDGFVDGFLIGIAISISMKAGIILSAANCLEMSFLGMAYASRLSKCTGSSKFANVIALYSPPVVMLIASGLGAAIGAAVQALPVIFIAMVSFGSVALLFLVCNELLIEAREAQGEEDKWYITIMIFLGIYLVLMLDKVI
jgi:zinc transporter, ZIP family